MLESLGLYTPHLNHILTIRRRNVQHQTQDSKMSFHFSESVDKLCVGETEVILTLYVYRKRINRNICTVTAILVSVCTSWLRMLLKLLYTGAEGGEFMASDFCRTGSIVDNIGKYLKRRCFTTFSTVQKLYKLFHCKL